MLALAYYTFLLKFLLAQSQFVKLFHETISQTDSEREEILKEKYNMQELTSAEKRELQQIILKKDKMSQDEEALIKNLSSI